MSFGFLIILVVFMIIGSLVSSQLKSRFKKYSKIPIDHGLSGKEVAEKMLQDNGIYDVNVVSVKGQLSDHYNPLKKTVNLSPDVYHGRSVASAAIAAHECGHAVQHATAYSMLQLRSALVPVQNISSTIINIIFGFGLFGFFFLSMAPDIVIPVVLVAYTGMTVFSLITLPVEINASHRALVWLNNSGITGFGTHEKAKDALKWAAYTYVVAALSSLAMMLYFLMLFLGSRD